MKLKYLIAPSILIVSLMSTAEAMSLRDYISSDALQCKRIAAFKKCSQMNFSGISYGYLLEKLKDSNFDFSKASCRSITPYSTTAKAAYFAKYKVSKDVVQLLYLEIPKNHSDKLFVSVRTVTSTDNNLIFINFPSQSLAKKRR